MSFSLKKLVHGGLKITGQALDPFGTVTGNPLIGGGGGGNSQAAKVDALSAQARTANAQNYARAEVERRRALGDVQGGYAKARGALAQGQTQAIQTATDQGSQAAANATQRLGSSGLLNTTIAQNAAQGVSAQTSRAVANINAQYAQMLATLGVNEGNAVAGIRQNIAGGAQSFGGSQAGLYANHAGLINSQPEQDPNAWLESLLQIGGTAIGYGISGPAGGAVGSQVGSGLSPGGATHPGSSTYNPLFYS